jgi:hypothetical protein
MTQTEVQTIYNRSRQFITASEISDQELEIKFFDEELQRNFRIRHIITSAFHGSATFSVQDSNETYVDFYQGVLDPSLTLGRKSTFDASVLPTMGLPATLSAATKVVTKVFVAWKSPFAEKAKSAFITARGFNLLCKSKDDFCLGYCDDKAASDSFGKFVLVDLLLCTGGGAVVGIMGGGVKAGLAFGAACEVLSQLIGESHPECRARCKRCVDSVACGQQSIGGLVSDADRICPVYPCCDDGGKSIPPDRFQQNGYREAIPN